MSFVSQKFVPSPYSHALPNKSEVKAAKKEAKYCTKAEKYKAKYQSCRDKRKAKGKSVHPDTERKKFLGIGPMDCEGEWKKWKKYAGKCGDSATDEVAQFESQAKSGKLPDSEGGGKKKGGGGGRGGGGGGSSADLAVSEAESADYTVPIVVGMVGLLTLAGGGYYLYRQKSRKKGSTSK